MVDMLTLVSAVGARSPSVSPGSIVTELVVSPGNGENEFWLEIKIQIKI